MERKEINIQHKHIDVKVFEVLNKLDLVGLPETKVKAHNTGNLYLRVFQGWCLNSNFAFHHGGRVVIAWNLGSFTVKILFFSSQVVHCLVIPTGGRVRGLASSTLSCMLQMMHMRDKMLGKTSTGLMK